MVRTLYTDEETDALEAKIMAKEPDFNFSAFYKECLLKKQDYQVRTSSVMHDIEGLKLKKSQIELQIKEKEGILVELRHLEARQKEIKDKINEFNIGDDGIKFFMSLERIPSIIESKEIGKQFKIKPSEVFKIFQLIQEKNAE